MKTIVFALAAILAIGMTPAAFAKSKGYHAKSHGFISRNVSMPRSGGPAVSPQGGDRSPGSVGGG